MNDKISKNTFILHNGVKMPVIGLGVWSMKDCLETEDTIVYAIQQGYRNIDTATFYKNEKSVGNAIRKSGIKREDMFVTTKLWLTDFLNPEKAFNRSLARLGLEYVDLYLIHWPIPLMTNRVWKKIEDIYKSGRAKAIGVSNFSISDLESLAKTSTISPMVNQIKFNPFSYDEKLLKYCKEKNILLEAYTPLNRAKYFDIPELQNLVKKYNKTAAQIILRWDFQKGVATIPKSKNKNRITENLDIFDFEISNEDSNLIDSLRN